LVFKYKAITNKGHSLYYCAISKQTVHVRVHRTLPPHSFKTS